MSYEDVIVSTFKSSFSDQVDKDFLKNVSGV